MILGCFINGYKSYGNTVYIDFHKDAQSRFTTLLGNNGVGKSAVLEAINYFFSNSLTWNANVASKNPKREFVSLFLSISKKDFHLALKALKMQSDELQKVESEVQTLSNAVKMQDSLVPKTSAAKSFWSVFRPNDFDYDQEYLLVLSKDAYRKIGIRPFIPKGIQIGDDQPSDDESKNDKNGKNNNEKIITDEHLNIIFEAIQKCYRYIYIPVEQNPDQALDLQDFDLQQIMNADFKKSIDDILGRKIDINEKTNSVIDYINDRLNDYMDVINKSLIDSNSEYKYQAKKVRYRLTKNDISSQIINSFFSREALQKVSTNKAISILSSGEQRQALIEVIVAFLADRGSQNVSASDNTLIPQIILAIDEPESSQDRKNVFNQFEKLETLSSHYDYQVFVTTHWYGLLPAVEHGTLVLVNDSNGTSQADSYLFFNLMDQVSDFVGDVVIKSLFDLSSSILAFSRAGEDKHVIICEGGTDKQYLLKHLNSSKVKVITAGGIDNVIKLFRIMTTADLPKLPKGPSLSPDVLCIIDADINQKQYSGFQPNARIKLGQWRLKKSEDAAVPTLYDCSLSLAGISEPVHIEQVLSPAVFYSALVKCVDTDGSSAEKAVMRGFGLNKSASNTFLFRTDGTGLLVDNEASIALRLPVLQKFVDRNKSLLEKLTVVST